MSMIPREDHKPVLIAFGVMANVVVLGIVALAVMSRPVPQVLEFLALTLASQLGGAMIALGFRPSGDQQTPPEAQRGARGSERL